MLEGLMVVGSGVAGTSIGLIVDAPLDGLGVVGSINGGVVCWRLEGRTVVGSLVSGTFIGLRVGSALDGVAVVGSMDADVV